MEPFHPSHVGAFLKIGAVKTQDHWFSSLIWRITWLITWGTRFQGTPFGCLCVCIHVRIHVRSVDNKKCQDYPRPSILDRIHFISVVDHNLLLTHAAGMLSGNIERQISSTQLDVLIPERARMDQGVSRGWPNNSWLVVYLPLWQIWKSVGVIIPIYGKKKMLQTTNQLRLYQYVWGFWRFRKSPWLKKILLL